MSIAFAVNPAVLTAYSTQYSSLAPNGGNGWFPEPGRYVCVLKDVQTRSFRKRLKSGREVQCTGVVVSWQLVEETEGGAAPRGFEDAMFVLYDNPLDISDDDGVRRTLERDLSRLKGHMNGVFGRETSLADLSRITERCGVAAVELDAVWESYTKDGVQKGPYRKCYVVAGCG